MYEILMVVYLVVSLALIGFILIQKGKGAGLGAGMGGGASGTVFGAGGSGNFLTKTTTILAIGFFGVALALGNLTSNKDTTEVANELFTEEDVQAIKGSEIPDASSEIPMQSVKNELPASSEIPTVTTEKEAKEDETVPKKEEPPQ